MKFDFVALLAFAALFIGACLLMSTWWPQGSGGADKAVPSQRVTGGWLPGGTTNGFRNGGIGSAQPIIWYN